MKYIEVKDGICVATDKIEAITKLTELTSLVYVESGMQYEANFPYNVLIDILERDKDVQEVASEKLINHLKFGQAFAG